VRIASAILISAAALALSGCGPEVQAPSLLPRATEKQPIDMPVAEASEAQTPVDPALQAAIDKQLEAAKAGDTEFAARRASAEQAVNKAAGKPQGSEDWVQAQEAVTALESARASVHDAAAAIEALRDDPANGTSGNREAIDTASKQVAAIEDAQAAMVAALTAKLG
jgi:hypothetical protein